MNKSEVTNLLERAKAVTQESPDEWTFEQWEPLARKHGFITFSGRNGFMDGYLVSYKKSKKITEAITSLAESYLEALEALEFYADIENWSLSEKHTSELNEGSKHSIIGGYTRIWGDHSDGGINLIGGKRAREFLRKIGEA